MNESNWSITGSSISPETGGGAQANTTPDEAEIARAVAVLRAGGLVGMPTETVYGLAGGGLNPAALARIFEVKHRPLYDPLILHFADAAAAFAVAREVPPAARVLAERFWPGPLTLVLPRRAIVPDLVTSGLPKVAVRVPAHPVAQALLRAFDGPLAAPSANRFGRISPTDAAAVRTELGDAVPLILDGGPCRVGLESTVLEVNADGIRLLRAGGISLEEIERLAGPVERANVASGNKPLAPGQLEHHYAPRKPLRLLPPGEIPPADAGAGWLAFGPVKGADGQVVENLSPARDLREAAANFFRALRTLDDHPAVTVIYATRPPPEGLGLAINERLQRAASR